MAAGEWRELERELEGWMLREGEQGSLGTWCFLLGKRSGEVGAGDRAVEVPCVRSTCVGLFIAGSPTELSLLSGAGPAEPGERVS